MERKELFEGIFLNTIYSDKFKTDYLSFNIILPLKKDTAAYCSLLPKVLKRCTKSYPTIASLNKKLDFLYSTEISALTFTRGELQIIGFTCDFLRGSLVPKGTDLTHEAAAVLFEILYNPLVENDGFMPEIIKSEKLNLTDEIKAQINNKNAYAMKRATEIMCEKEPYGVNPLGTVEDVEKISEKSLYAFYKEILKNARIEIFFNGMESGDEITQLISGMLSDKERSYIKRDFETVVIPKAESIKEVVDEMEVNQGKLTLGFRTPYSLRMKNFTAFTVFNEVFGSGPNSKLFENVREKLSLCYYCRSVPEAHKGIMLVSSGIEVENKKKAQDEILLQLSNMRDGIISDEEMDSAKKSIQNSYREISDSAHSLCIWHLSRVLADDFSTPEENIEGFMKIGKQEIAAVAKNISLDTVYFLKGTLSGQEQEESD